MLTNKSKLSDLKVNKLVLVLVLLSAAFLRFFSLSINPPGLYWDEAAFGYDAFSIIKTGRDHHGQYLPLFFESFGDWKLPGYFYLLVPSIAVFGLTEIAVRFPSALLGTLTIFIIYLFTKSAIKVERLAICSAFILAVSSWHIQFSRAGFEATVALFVTLLATLLFCKSQDFQNAKILIASAILFALSQYIYHSYRIFIPLLVLGLGIIYSGTLLETKKLTFLAALIFTIVSLPIFIFSFSREGQSRASSQTAFQKDGFKEAKLDFDQRSKPPFRFLSGKIYKEPLYYSQIALKNYLGHFSPVFLFFRGDQVGRHSQVDIGQLHIFELVLISIGLFELNLLKNKRFVKLIIFWLLISPIPAIIVAPSPHANRALQMVIPLAILGALGLNRILSLKSKLIPTIFSLWMLTVFLIYLHSLFVHYPKKFAANWQDGNRQMVEKLSKVDSPYPKVYLANTDPSLYIYLLFYKKYDPSLYQKYGSPSGFDKYQLIKTYESMYVEGEALYVAPAWQKIDGRLISVITNSNHEEVFKIWEIGGTY